MDNVTEAAMPDMSRLAATGSDNDYTLSLEEASERYAKAGHPRTLRSLQRYCATGHLDAQKLATTTGDKYLVTPQSVARHIAQIEELSSFDNVATGRDLSRPVATHVAPKESLPEQVTPDATGSDVPRQAATDNGDESRYVARLEREVEQAKDERDFLREQIDRKDRTIDSLLERDRETNFLIRGLQELIPRLGIGRSETPRPEQPDAQ